MARSQVWRNTMGRLPGWLNSWYAMKRRCECPDACNYKWYGGKGVTVCKEWHDRNVFKEWAFTHGWFEGATIDRIDRDKGYCPENCRWATMKEQTRNRATNCYLTYNGETRCIRDWSDITGIKWGTLYSRHKKGKSIDEIFSKKNARYKDKDINVETIRRKGNEPVLHGYVRRTFQDRHRDNAVKEL